MKSTVIFDLPALKGKASPGTAALGKNKQSNFTCPVSYNIVNSAPTTLPF